MSDRTTAADALHQAGQRREAGALFAAAEAMQREGQPEFPLLYSLQGSSGRAVRRSDGFRFGLHILAALPIGQIDPTIERRRFIKNPLSRVSRVS